VVGEGAAALFDAATDEGQSRRVVDTGGDTPYHERDADPEQRRRNRKNEKGQPHSDQTGSDESPRLESVDENSARQGAQSEQSVADCNQRPQRRLVDRNLPNAQLERLELGEPDRNENRNRQLVGVDHCVGGHGQTDNRPVVRIHDSLIPGVRC
jgi:hypothetical protein